MSNCTGLSFKENREYSRDRFKSVDHSGLLYYITLLREAHRFWSILRDMYTLRKRN
jgi:hypothetical protein